MNRRELLGGAALAGAALATEAGSSRRAVAANDKVVLGVMGVNGRGSDVARGFAATGKAEIAYVCDVDDRAIAKGLASVGRAQMTTPKTVKDFRRILDDPSVDALIVAAPDHWHAPATIMAVNAGKHVYCEKPASHNAHEGEMAIAAARKHNKVVQIGTQRRSMPTVIDAIQKLKAGEIGRVLFARGWYNNARPSIGHGKPAPVPGYLDYTLWQGPAPEREYKDNLIHYNWHWFWHWGTGELGNNGIHSLDVCRWGLGVDYPTRVTAGGGKYRHDDDQETPDSMITTYDFGDKFITWEGRSWSKRGFEDSGFGIAFYGENGTMVLDGGNVKVLDANGKEVRKVAGSSSDAPHFLNFMECVRNGGRPNADVEHGVKSTLLCHLGNIAWRTGHTLNINPENGHVKDDSAAQKLWGREYRPGWEPKV